MRRCGNRILLLMKKVKYILLEKRWYKSTKGYKDDIGNDFIYQITEKYLDKFSLYIQILNKGYYKLTTQVL